MELPDPRGATLLWKNVRLTNFTSPLSTCDQLEMEILLIRRRPVRLRRRMVGGYSVRLVNHLQGASAD
eukprot:533962-Prymnesium_polylepis.1